MAIDWPDFMGDMYKGALAQKARDEIESRNRMAPYVEPALQGDTGALAKVFQASPDTGYRIAHTIAVMDAAKRKTLTEYTDFITRDGLGILQAPAAQRPALYDQTLAAARARGYDVSSMPPVYGPDAEAKLKFFVQRATPFATAIKRMGAPAGGPAPAAGGWGGPPAPRVSAAPTPADGPMVAGAPPPVVDAGDDRPPQAVASLPQPAPAPAAPPAARPPAAGAGPMPMAMPPAPSVAPAAPQAPAQPFAAPAGPMTAQAALQPPAAPAAPVDAPAPAPVQAAGVQPPQAPQVISPDQRYAQGADGDFVGGSDAERAFKLNPGESIKLEPKTGKPIVDGGGVWVQAKDGSVEWRLLDPQGRPVRVQQVDLGDRVRILGSGGENLGEIPKGRSPNAAPRAQTANLGDRTIIIGPDGEEIRSYQHGRAPRPVDNSGRDDLTKVGAPALEVSALVRDFKDDYGGYLPGVGPVSNAWRRNRGDDTGQAQWWQRYDAVANEIRHNLFGSALTATEKTAFEAAMITPSMDAGEIRKNLARQRAVMLRAAARTAGGMIKGGANQDEVEHYLGLHMKDLPDAFADVPTSPPAAGGQPKRLRFNPATGELE